LSSAVIKFLLSYFGVTATRYGSFVAFAAMRRGFIAGFERGFRSRLASRLGLENAFSQDDCPQAKRLDIWP
jgi:hypothetical protein